MFNQRSRIGQALFLGTGIAVIGSLLGQTYIGAVIGLILAAILMSGSASAANVAVGAVIGAVAGIIVAFGQMENTILLQAALPALTRIPSPVLSLLLAAALGAVLGAGLSAALSWIHRGVATGQGFFW
jgi:hypothetical protein